MTPQKKWLLNNAEKVKKATRARRRRADVKIKSAAYAKSYAARRGPTYKMVLAARSRAKARGLECDLPLDWKASITTCELTGLPFVKGCRLYAASIDRIDNDKGYTVENYRLVLCAVNHMKNTGTDEDVYHIAAALLNHRKDVQ